MKIEDIISMWQDDVQIDETELGRESLKIPLLHGKYIKHWSDARLKLKSLRMKQKKLNVDLLEYYRGEKNNPEDLKDLGREPYPYKRLKQDVTSYVESDSDMVALNLKIAYQQELVDVLEEIIKAINTRGYVIKNCLDYNKFINGQ